MGVVKLSIHTLTITILLNASLLAWFTQLACCTCTDIFFKITFNLKKNN